MANYGGATKGYAPLSTFKEDIYAELEKPISTQNLDAVLQKIWKVQDEVARARKGIDETLGNGGKVSTKAIESLASEAKNAGEILDFVTKKLEELNKFSNAKVNFANKYEDVNVLRNSVASIKQSAHKGVEDATGVTARKEQQKKQAEADAKAEAERIKREEENARKIKEEKQKAQEATTAVIPDASQQENGKEVLPAEQVKAQSESIVKSATEAKEAIQEVVVQVYNAQRGLFEFKKVPISKLPKVEEEKKEEKKEEDTKPTLSNAERRKRAAENGKYNFPVNEKGEVTGEHVKGENVNTKADNKAEESNRAEIGSYQELLYAIEAIKKAKEELSNKIYSGESKDYQADIATLKQYEKTLKGLEATKNQVEKNAQSSVQGQSNSDEEKQAMNIFSLLKETVSIKAQLAKEKATLPFSGDMEDAQERIEGLKSRMKDLSSIWASMNSGPIVNAFNAIKSAASSVFKSVGSNVWNSIKSGVQSVIPSIVNLAKNGFGVLKNAVSTTFGNMQKLVSGGFNAIKNGANIAKKSFNGIKNAMHQIVKKSTPNMMRSLTSLKSMLMRRIKRTFISSIFNQAKEGLQELAKSSDDFNQSMSNIKNMASQVSGNLAITLGNLIQTVEPVLMKILNFINSIFSAINGLFAMISGKSTMLVAKKGTDDYAKSLKKASGAAKDLNHQLYGFDEITRQEDNSGGGGGGGKIGYEEQDIGNALGSWSDFFKEMLEAFKSGQFEKVGQLVAKQLTSVTKKINDWVKKLRPQATKWSSNIARILNGMLDPEMFKSFGELFASGINLAFDVVNTFFETFHFDELGECLAEGLNKMFGDIEWELVGTTIINYFNSIWQTLGNFFESLNWEDIGHNLAMAVYAIFDNIDWESFKQMWSEGINGVFKLLYTFFADIDWGKIASDFVTNFVDLIQNRIDWVMIKNALSSMLLSILDVFHVLVSSDFFINLATRLGEVVNGILNDVNWEQLAADIIIGLAKLRTAFWSFIGELDIPTLATKLANAINGLFTNEEVQKAIEESKKKVKEGIDKIIKGFRNLVDPNEGINFGEIGSTIGKEVGDLLKDVDWTTLAESIGLGVSGLVEAFGKLLTGLDLPNVAIKISEGINALFDPQKGGAKFDDAILAVSTGVNSLIDGFANLIDPQNGIKFDSIASTLAEKVNGLIKRVDWSKLISTFVLLKIDLYNALFKAIGEIDWETLGSKIATSINDLFTSDRLASLGENIGKALTSVLEGITSLIADIKWDEVANGIVEFIKNIKWADVLTAIVNCLTAAVVGVGDLLQGFWTAIFGGGSEDVEIPQVLSDNIMSQLKGQMGEAGKELANALTESLVENLQGAGSNYESAKMLFINSMALIGQGGQEEFEKTMKEWNVDDATTAALAQNVCEVYEALGAPNATLQSVQEKFHENGIYITNGLAEALIGQGSENIATAMQLLALGVDEKTIEALDLTHLNENLTNYMNETGTDITTIAGALGADVGKEIGDKIPEAVKEALGKGEKEVEETAEKVVKAADTSAQQANAKANATATGEAVATNIGKAEEDNAYKVENGADTIKKSIDGKISELPEEEKKQATKMMDYIIKGIEEGDPLVKTAINSAAQAMIDKFKEILNSKQGIQIAKDFINGMWSTFNTDTSVSNSMQNIAKTTRDTAMAYLNATNGMTIGGNMIIGMINGMNAYGTMLVMTIAKICNVSVQTARDILGIKSPSKVFAEIGEYTMEGMQIGLENEGKNAVNTVANLAKEITSEGEGTTFGVMSNGLDTVADKLTRIADVFSDIADVITQMGGSLQIPTIAAGQTIPYRTQLGANGGSFSNGEALDATAIENAFYSAITRAMSNSDNSQNINVYLDGRQIADSVTKYQRRQARAMGV